MKKLPFYMSIAALLASTSTATLASSVTIPNSFASGTPAVAAEVNANFDAVAVGVNDNDSRITVNAGDISTNTGGISTNAGAISALDTRVSANEVAITALQSGATTCPSDMTAVGSLCVDLYEASLWDAATGGTQISPGGAAPYYPCAANGSDCGGVIFAQSVASVAGVIPAQRVTWHQAVQACNNVGKRLPTAAEWQMAAAGTPEGTGDGITGCNSDSANLGPVATGNAATCVSTAGAFDMVGNVWEWVADISPRVTGSWTLLDSTTDFSGLAFGEGYDNASGSTPDPRVVIVLDGTFAGVADAGLLTTNSRNGFRCVR